ncbi:MAG: outer membrane beta-barrel protein, partial [Paludibacteraceae bacterium]|nr:outer membrane beta-barrel protein [Paludibacteraceae bacterium]
MSETVGNLGLNPAFRNIVRAMYSRYNQDRLSSLTTGVRANFTKDALVYNTIYDNTGKAYRQTVNAKATPFDVSGDLMYNTPVIKNRLHFFTRTEVGYNQRIAYVSHTNDAVDSYNMPMGEESKTGNWRASENLSLRLSHDVIDFGVRGNIVYSRTNNSQTSNITNTIDWGVTADFTFHLPYNWSISTDIGYNDKWGYNLSGSLSEIMWNATVEKTWRNATLSLNMKDILNQKKNVVETIGENYIQYQRFNTLPTYFTLSFTYKLNKMGDLKATGRGAFMQEMIENGGKFKPGSGPMGPPPGLRN